VSEGSGMFGEARSAASLAVRCESSGSRWSVSSDGCDGRPPVAAGAVPELFESRAMRVLELMPPTDKGGIATVAGGVLSIPHGAAVELRGCLTFRDVVFKGSTASAALWCHLRRRRR
jgi:hypothetical protein